MKKIIGILGVAVFAVTLFLGTNSNNTDLSDVLAMNIAKAHESEAIYIKEHVVCEFYIEGEAGTTFTKWGITFTIPVSGHILIKATAGVDCRSGGDYVCATHDCFI